MNVAYDIDGCADSFPRVAQSTMSALKAAGHHVTVLTGVEAPQATAADQTAKAHYLSSLGIGPDDYNDLVVVPKPHPKNKAQIIKSKGINMLFDNNKKNCKAAAKQGCVAFLLTNSQEK